jgi:hypothetical protein
MHFLKCLLVIYKIPLKDKAHNKHICTDIALKFTFFVVGVVVGMHFFVAG